MLLDCTLAPFIGAELAPQMKGGGMIAAGEMGNILP